MIRFLLGVFLEEFFGATDTCNLGPFSLVLSFTSGGCTFFFGVFGFGNSFSLGSCTFILIFSFEVRLVFVLGLNIFETSSSYDVFEPIALLMQFDDVPLSVNFGPLVLMDKSNDVSDSVDFG